MHKVFGIDNETWLALGAIGTILGAIGTVTAVIVALRLARRDYYPQLRVTNAIMQMVEPTASSGDCLEFVTISGTNMGRIVITVKGIFWTIGWFRRQTFVTVPYNNPFSTLLPKEISHGQQVLLAQPLPEFFEGLDTFVRYLKNHWFPRVLVRSLRCGLYTSIGVDFSCPADARICDLVRKRVLSQNQQFSSGR